jgi:hypothetical protein
MKRKISIVFGLASLMGIGALAAEVTPPRGSTPAAKAVAAVPKPASKPMTLAKEAPVEKLAPPPNLPVTEIVDRNIASRGGLDAWHAVTSMTISGEMDAGGKQDAKLPFVLSLKRPHLNRLEIKFQEQAAVQVWDGQQGWKVRPYLNRNEVEPYTAAEVRSAAASAELDGPLIDFAKKGTKVEVVGAETVEGKNAYKLRLTRKGGEQIHVWIDAGNFLEVKIDGEPRRMDGRMHPVTIFYRDYKPVNGLKIPHTMETVVGGIKGSHKMTIVAVKVNPPMEDSLFAKPQLVLARASAP